MNDTWWCLMNTHTRAHVHTCTHSRAEQSSVEESREPGRGRGQRSSSMYTHIITFCSSAERGQSYCLTQALLCTHMYTHTHSRACRHLAVSVVLSPPPTLLAAFPFPNTHTQVHTKSGNNRLRKQTQTHRGAENSREVTLKPVLCPETVRSSLCSRPTVVTR